MDQRGSQIGNSKIKKVHQRLIVTYSFKYAKYQKTIRDTQVKRAEKMLNCGKVKKPQNSNDPTRLIIKTDFEARPVLLHDDVRIKAHFLIGFLSLVIYRYLERELKHAFNCKKILGN